MAGDPGGEFARADAIADDRRLDRRLDKFGRLMGMRERPDAQPAPWPDQPQADREAPQQPDQAPAYRPEDYQPFHAAAQSDLPAPGGVPTAPSGYLAQGAVGHDYAAAAPDRLATAMTKNPADRGQPGPEGSSAQGYAARGYAPQGYPAQEHPGEAFPGRGHLPAAHLAQGGYPAQGLTRGAQAPVTAAPPPGGAAARGGYAPARGGYAPAQDAPAQDAPAQDYAPYGSYAPSQSYAGPGYAGPGYAGPGYAGPGYAGPGYAGPGYAGPGYAGPGYAGPGYAAPGDDPASPAGQGQAAGWPGRYYAPAPDEPAAPRAGTAGFLTDSGVAPAPMTAAPMTAAPMTAAPLTAAPVTAAPAPAGYTSAGYTSAGLAPSGTAGRGYSAPAHSLAPEAEAAPAVPAAAADSSAEPLYRVLGGLALRDLTLVESLLELVEQLESREEDPQQLDSLFRVDHLATRMRRNSENLLVLAGQDRESQDFDPISLLDVARAAVSEIADYNRAQVKALPAVRLLGVAADDVTHILAELLDNAMSKSPESAEVVIEAERTGDGTLVVSVEDSGIGIPVDRLNEINARLSRVPVVDVAVTRHMGLYVVGRLAHRHGIRVQLRERPYGGIVASVVIPSQLVRNDPDAPREIVPVENPGRYQQVGSAGPLSSQLSIEARGADGLRAQRQGFPDPAAPAPYDTLRHDTLRHDTARRDTPRDDAPWEAGDRDDTARYDTARDTVALPVARAFGTQPSAPAGTGWPDSAGRPGAGQVIRRQPAPAPAAGYRDAVPALRFEPADPSELPKRKPGTLSAANGIPAPAARHDEEARRDEPAPPERLPVPADEEPAAESEADRIRKDLAQFQIGQRAAHRDVSAAAEPGDSHDTGPDTGTDTSKQAGGALAEAGDTDEA